MRRVPERERPSACIYLVPTRGSSPGWRFRLNRPRRAPIPEQPPLRRAVVLLVDDDSEVRAATADMLRYVGHDVIEAAGGREALDHLDREGDVVDLMIVDYVMPGMNGLEVARLGRLRRPSLPILFVTGFADTAVLAAETPSDHILRKPFTVADLVAKTGAVLRTGSTR